MLNYLPKANLDDDVVAEVVMCLMYSVAEFGAEKESAELVVSVVAAVANGEYVVAMHQSRCL